MNTSSEIQVVTFKLKDETFAVNIFEVREIIRHGEITAVPEAEDFMEGIINLRGKVISIINLAKKIHVPSNDVSNNTRIIVVETNNSEVGMRVDEVTRVLKFQKGQVQPPPKIIADRIGDEFIEGVAILNEEPIILLDLSKVLDFAEIQHLQEESNHVVEEKSEANNNQQTEIISKPKETHSKTKKTLKKSDEGFHFITLEGNQLKNAKELHEYVLTLEEDEFRNFVNEEKNDFYEWLTHSVKDIDLANKIKHIKRKKDLTNELLNHLREYI